MEKASGNIMKLANSRTMTCFIKHNFTNSFERKSNIYGINEIFFEEKWLIIS